MINSRRSLGEYCLRQLGAPVIQINVAPEQVSDRIDDAIQKFQEFHDSGSERNFIAYTITPEIIEQKFIEVEDNVLSVLRVLPLSNMYSASTNLQIQATITDIMDMVRMPVGNMSSYVINMQYISMLSEMFNSSKPTRYNRYTSKIYIDTSWQNNIGPGDILIAEVYTYIDPSDSIEAYNDPWIKGYSTALIKKQWGQNMLKYQGFQLPSGVVLDGRSIYEDAIREIEKLEEDLLTMYSLPVDFFVG